MKTLNFPSHTTRFGFGLVFITLLLGGCGGGGGGGTTQASPPAAITLTRIAIAPASVTVGVGATSKLTATGTYSNGKTADITSSVTWQSADSTIASVAPKTNVVTGIKIGNTTITATMGGITSPTDKVTVTAATLASIAITPASASVTKGNTVTFTATGTYSDGTTGNISGSVTWASANPNTASVSGTGVTTGNAIGTTSIAAAMSGITSPAANVTVSAAILNSIAIIPASAVIAVGTTAQLAATGTYSDATTADISSIATWVSAAPGTASVGSAGLVTGVAVGATGVTAALNGITSPAAPITVNAVTLTGIAITPASATITIGGSTTFTATGTYSNGATGNISGSVTWNSSNTAVATINASGIASGVSGGSTSITATLTGITSNTAMLSIPLNAWTTQTPLRYARDNDANAVLGGKVYVFGGAPTGTTVLSSMEVYDPVSNTWPTTSSVTSTPWPAMPVPRYGLAAVSTNGVIYLIGGTKAVNGQGPIYPILVYDPTTNVFASVVPGTNTPLANLPTGRWGFHAVAVDGIVYAIGGSVFVPGGITPTNWSTNIIGASSGAAITALTNGIPYYFVVTAVDATTLKESAGSFAVSATPLASSSMGATPTGLSTAAGNGQASLSWTGVSGATSYNVYYSVKSSDATSNMTKVSGTAATSSTVSGLVNGTAYYFVVTAVIGSVETLPSTEVSVTPQTAPPASAPPGVSVTAGNGQVTLSWASVPNAASYNVYYGTGVSVYYGNVDAYDPVANTWTTRATMPTPRRGLAVTVVNGKIYAIGGWGGWPELAIIEVYDPVTNTWSTTVPVSAATIATNTAATPLASMPTARDDFGFSVVNGNIYAMGGDTNAFDALLGIPCCTTAMEVYDPVANIWSTLAPLPTMRDDFDASAVDGVIYAIAGSRDGKFNDPTLPNNGGYSLTANEAYWSSYVPVPGGVTATAGANQVSLAWNAVIGATSYNIYWSNKAGVSTTANSTKISGATKPYVHTGLTAGTWYYYVVTAMTASGESLPSAEVAVKP